MLFPIPVCISLISESLRAILKIIANSVITLYMLHHVARLAQPMTQYAARLCGIITGGNDGLIHYSIDDFDPSTSAVVYKLATSKIMVSHGRRGTEHGP